MRPRRVRAAHRERRRLRHGDGDAGPHLRAVLHDQSRRPRAPASGWPPSTASSSRTTASSTSTASRIRERRSRSTCPAMWATAEQARTETRDRPAAARPRDDPAGGGRADHPDADRRGCSNGRATPCWPPARPGEALRLATRHAGEIHLLHDRRGHARDERPDSGQEPAVRSSRTSSACSCRDTRPTSFAHHGVLDEGVHFIQKPFSTEDLAAKVREVLDAER